jgi:hypothetical protein
MNNIEELERQLESAQAIYEQRSRESATAIASTREAQEVVNNLLLRISLLKALEADDLRQALREAGLL